MGIDQLKWYSTWLDSTLTLSEWGKYLPELLNLIKIMDWVRPLKLPSNLMVADGIYINTPFVLPDLSKKMINVLEFYVRARNGGLSSTLRKRGLDTKNMGRSLTQAEKWISTDFTPLSETSIHKIFLIMQGIHNSAVTPTEKKSLPNDINDFFYNPRMSRSWFLECLDLFMKGATSEYKTVNISEYLRTELERNYTLSFFVALFGVYSEQLDREFARLEQWLPKAALIIVNSQMDGGESLAKWEHLCSGYNKYAGAYWVIRYLNYMSSGLADMVHSPLKMLEPGCDMIMNFLKWETINDGMKFDCRYTLLESVK